MCFKERRYALLLTCVTLRSILPSAYPQSPLGSPVLLRYKKTTTQTLTSCECPLCTGLTIHMLAQRGVVERLIVAMNAFIECPFYKN